MELELLRVMHGPDATLGALRARMGPGVTHGLCWSLEDEYRTRKVYGETRIPAGRFPVELRTEGGFHGRYLERFGPEFHRGMLWVRNVPGFRYVLVHIGNDDDDTAGCILVGDGAIWRGHSAATRLTSSTAAYRRIYPPIAARLQRGDEVWLNVVSV